MKKTLLLQLCAIVLAISFIACKDKDHTIGDGKDTTKVQGAMHGELLSSTHAPTSGADSILFNPDSPSLINLFCPNGDTNRVVINDVTPGYFAHIFDTTVSALKKIDSLLINHTYSIRAFNGRGTSTFSHVVSSFKNMSQPTIPFRSYTEYFNNSDSQGPNQGVVVIIMGNDLTDPAPPKK